MVYNSGFNNGFNSVIWDVKAQHGLTNPWGLGAAGHLHGVGSRAEASQAMAHPTTPSREQDRPGWEAAGGSPETRSSKMSIEIKQV